MLAPITVAEADLLSFCSLRDPSELSPQSVRLHAPDASYMVHRDGIAAARCSLWWSATPMLPQQRVGLVGHYAARDAQAASEILQAACTRLKAAGCTLAIGPMDGNTWRRYRLLTWRGTDPPFFLELDNPDDWPAHFEHAGFSPFAHYYSAKCDDLVAYPADAALDDRVREAGYSSRPIDMSKLDQELALLWSLASDAFSRNFLYTPFSEVEYRQMYAAVIPAVRPELVRIVTLRGDPVAFVFAIPDILQAGRGEQVDTVILKTVGVTQGCQGQGIGNWMVDRLFVQARELGFRRGVFALMHESNPSRKLGRGRMRDIRRYTLFARPL
jgi:GNAT superfamily N-acetyltransferase